MISVECCGKPLVVHGHGGDWGDWRCQKCRRAYCQDCGGPIDMNTMQCIAYEDAREKENQSEPGG